MAVLVISGAATLLALPQTSRSETRVPCVVDDTYQGPHADAFQALRFMIPGLADATQIQVSSKMGLDYTEGFRYPLTIGFVDESLAGGEYALAYVREIENGAEIRQRMNINLEAYARDTFNFEKIFTHEMSHAIFADAVGIDTFRKLPVWLIEGLALWVADQGEALTRAEAHRYPAYAEKILVADLEQPRQARLYPQYFLAIAYIEKTKGAGALQNLVRDLAAGKPYREALADDVGEDWGTFQKNVRNFSIAYIRDLGTGSPLDKEQPY